MNEHTQCFGLVGGLGVAAGIHYYEALTEARRVAGKPLKFVMAHAEVSRVFELAQLGQTQTLAEYLAGYLDQLHRAGATYAALPAVLPHICIGELVRRSPIPLVSLLDVVRKEIELRGLPRVALFGTRFAVETGLFGSLGDIDLVKPRAEEIESLHKAYSRLVFDGKGSAEVRGCLIDLANSLIKREKVQLIVLAGTDFSVIFNERNAPFPALDCARVHIDAILHEMS